MSVRDLHDRAVVCGQKIHRLLVQLDVGDDTLVARLTANDPAMLEIRALAADALSYEEQAADLVPVVGGEPTRSTLYVGAANYALLAGNPSHGLALLQKAAKHDPAWEPSTAQKKRFALITSFCLLFLSSQSGE